MLRKALSGLMIILMVLGICGCRGGSAQPSEAGKVRISVSFNALREFAAAVGGDKVSITVIVPDGMEPHDFEPKAQDVLNLSKADLFVYNGLGMEKWAKDTVASAGNQKLISVDASLGIEPIVLKDQVPDSKEGAVDPHIWLSLKNAEKEAANIKEALIKLDPANSGYYEKNYSDFSASLEKLYGEYQQKFQPLTKKAFVTAHAAFAYLCRDFGLTQTSVEDVFAEGEPSAQKLTELIAYCKENRIKTIFSEELISSDIADTLAREAGAKVEKIYTIESSEDNLSYIDRMRSNLSLIYDSLK